MKEKPATYEDFQEFVREKNLYLFSSNWLKNAQEMAWQEVCGRCDWKNCLTNYIKLVCKERDKRLKDKLQCKNKGKATCPYKDTLLKKEVAND
ncbi:MAG: hypothetical protein LBC75_02540 [Fibromonadaceae bacterium]|jgi:hypothetical protein|nr:hypothetical protein [Fibromonadaceae bacterium]